MILTPDNPEFQFTMENLPPPPNWRSHDVHGETGLIQDLNSGMWIPVNQSEFIETMIEQGDLYFQDEDD